jgi:hypothetical protein
MAYMVCSNKKDGVSHGGLKTTELEFQFLVILVRDITGFQNHQNQPWTTLLFQCCRGNDKSYGTTLLSIAKLLVIVGGRGLVRRRSANDHFLQEICSFCALPAVIFDYLRFGPFSSAWYMNKRGARGIAPHSTIPL